MMLMRVAELLLLTVITVLLIRAAGDNIHSHTSSGSLTQTGSLLLTSDSVLHFPGNQRAPERSPAGRRSGAAATQVHCDEDEDEGPVHYENSVRLH
ncbi:hypothetical protein INR49_021864 [Caranx melampygus]|nr:hypothetical protein INR49_021864 [Caranx melampygus]